MTPLGPYYSLQEAAQVVGKSPHTLKNRIHRGALPAQKIGKTWFVHYRTLVKEYPAAFKAS
jgi:excisionase family DNA binding protein